jgi:hypothetical protein
MVVDDYVAGWVFLPDDAPRMHRTTSPGATLCGRQLGATTPVHLGNPQRAFSICLGCREAGAQYPIPKSGNAPESTPERTRRRVVSGRTPGWVHAPPRQPRPRMVRGGLPTLGRDR